jgi:hypothetical protein
VPVASVFRPLFVPSVVDKNASHGFGSGAEEVATTIPVLRFVRINQTKVGFVNQRRRLKRLPRPFLSHLLRGQLPQLIINQRQKLFCGVRVAGFDLRQDLCDVGHGRRLFPHPTCR